MPRNATLTKTSRGLTAVVFLAGLLLAACTAAPQRLSDDAIAALIASPDRSAADRANDARRKPDKMLAFSGIAPGWRVLDLGAGGGYSTELVARAVGASGRVYAQSEPMQAAARERFMERLKTPANRMNLRRRTRCPQRLHPVRSMPSRCSLPIMTWAIRRLIARK